ncbi:hypothetical protein HK099_001107, partial [Clydaea vesicula]
KYKFYSFLDMISDYIKFNFEEIINSSNFREPSLLLVYNFKDFQKSKLYQTDEVFRSLLLFILEKALSHSLIKEKDYYRVKDMTNTVADWEMEYEKKEQDSMLPTPTFSEELFETNFLWKKSNSSYLKVENELGSFEVVKYFFKKGVFIWEFEIVNLSSIFFFGMIETDFEASLKKFKVLNYYLLNFEGNLVTLKTFKKKNFFKNTHLKKFDKLRFVFSLKEELDLEKNFFNFILIRDDIEINNFIGFRGFTMGKTKFIPTAYLNAPAAINVELLYANNLE